MGINNIPPKICTYSCIYCQLGRTKNMQVERAQFYKPEEIVKYVEKKVQDAKARGEPIDYLTFVSDGEPTLDKNIGKEIELLRHLGIKIAVISNSSLIWRKDVQNELCKADWVSFKIDAVHQDIWYRINRPNKSLSLDKILNSISEFAHNFNGELVTETMLIRDINDNIEELESITNFIEGLNPKNSYISIPIRPPAEAWVKSATEQTLNWAFQLFKDKAIDVEFLTGYEGNAFAFTGNIEEDLLSIMSVHPMREEGVNEFLKKANGNWDIIEKLITNGKLVEMEYKEKRFYMKKIKSG